ncbi:MAG: hypothetical protein ACM34K_17755 [Bacillota bacterium]
MILPDLPLLDLTQLNVQNGYSEITIKLVIGTQSSAFPMPMAAVPDNPPTKVVATIESITNTPLIDPDKSRSKKIECEFRGDTPLDIQTAINDSLGLGHFIKIA